jgi:adenosylcobinamide-phosphate synthase
MLLLDHIPILILALTIDALVGDPNWFYRKIPHPVAIMGFLIKGLDLSLNIPSLSYLSRKLLGVLALFINLSLAGGIGWLIQKVIQDIEFGWIIESFIIAIFLAQNSLYKHVHNVAKTLSINGLASARISVSHIVGRDTSTLNEAGICRATIESLSENFSDGIIAPVFWYLMAGLPGILIYKALNTADSMIGHLNERYEAFGWASARLDDAANFIPARLTAITICLTAMVFPKTNGFKAVATGFKDAKQHRSVNAGWPEATMAGALGIRIAGPRIYDGIVTEDAWMGNGNSNVSTADIYRALRLYCGANILSTLCLGALMLI